MSQLKTGTHFFLPLPSVFTSLQRTGNLGFLGDAAQTTSPVGPAAIIVSKCSERFFSADASGVSLTETRVGTNLRHVWEVTFPLPKRIYPTTLIKFSSIVFPAATFNFYVHLS